MSIHFNHREESIYKAIYDDSGIPLSPSDGMRELLKVLGITEEGMRELKLSELCERIYLHFKEDKVSASCLMAVVKVITDDLNNKFQEFEKETTPWYKRIF